GGRPVEHLAHRAHDGRHDDGLSAVAVGVLAPHVAAQAVQDPMELALGVVKASRAAPAVRATVDAGAAVPVVDAPELAGQMVDRDVPADGHERLGAAPRIRAGAAIEPAAADHGLRGPGAMAQAGDDGAE